MAHSALRPASRRSATPPGAAPRKLVPNLSYELFAQPCLAAKKRYAFQSSVRGWLVGPFIADEPCVGSVLEPLQDGLPPVLCLSQKGYVYAYIHVLHIHVYMHACMHACMSRHRHICMCTCIHYIYIYIYTQMRCLEGPIRWRMGWPHVAGRGGPRHTRTHRNFGTLATQCACC